LAVLWAQAEAVLSRVSNTTVSHRLSRLPSKGLCIKNRNIWGNRIKKSPWQKPRAEYMNIE
jgi:hypothetical protein